MALSYAHSPLGDYLKDTGLEEESDLLLDFAPVAANAHLEEADVPTGTTSEPNDVERLDDGDALPPTTTTTTPTTTEATARMESSYFSDQIKYTLATSALLQPHLSDALPLYTPLESVHSPHQVSTPTTTHPTRGGAPPKRGGPKPLEWGEGWDEKGQSWADRTLDENLERLARMLGAWCVWALVTLWQRLRTWVGEARAEARAEATAPAVENPQENVAPLPVPPKPRLDALESSFLESLSRFTSTSQELDLRLARALGGIREVECVGWGLGLSDPLPPISRIEASQLRSFTPSLPLSMNRSPSIVGAGGAYSTIFNSSSASSSPPIMRAKSLRNLILTTLASLSTSLSNVPGLEQSSSTSTLAGIIPSPAVPGSDDDEGATTRNSNRREVQKRATWQGPPSTGYAPLFNPSSSKPIQFGAGGVERQNSLKTRLRMSAGSSSLSGSASPGRGRRSMSRDGSAQEGTFSPTPPTSADSSPKRSPVFEEEGWGRISGRRMRPTSLNLGSPAGGKKWGSRGRDRGAGLGWGTVPGEEDPAQPPLDAHLSLATLQTSFEVLHSKRLHLLWHLLSTADSPSMTPSGWGTIRNSLESLSCQIEDSIESLRDAVEHEFGEGLLGSEGLLVRRSKEERRRSFLPFDKASSTGISNQESHKQRQRPVSWSFATSTSLPPGSPFPPARVRNTLLSASLSHHSFSTLLPSSLPPSTLRQSFARPPSNSVDALTTLENENATISLSLRSIAAKVCVVSQDTKRLKIDERDEQAKEREKERVLRLHESVRTDLDVLSRAWEEARIALRGVLESGGSQIEREAEEEDNDGEKNTSLSSFADDDNNVSEDVELPSPPLRPTSLDFDSNDFSLPLPSSATVDANLGAYLPPPGEELIFEAVAGGTERGESERGKMSREERISAAQEARKRNVAVGAGGRKTRIEPGMVRELKDVLRLLKGRGNVMPLDVVEGGEVL